MIHFRHRGCTSPVATFLGPKPTANLSGPSRLWRWADGSPVTAYTGRVGQCPDCHATISIHPAWLERVKK